MIDSEIMKRSILVERWLEENIRKFKMLYPGIDEKKLGEILLDVLQQRGNNPKTLLHNNYQRQEINSTVLDMYDWAKTKKPIIAGGGVYFMNQTKKHSPIYTVIKKRKKKRKFYQHRRDTHPADSYEWWYDDMMNTESKVKINAIYGSFGTPTFQFYNLYTAMATTLTSQMMIAATGIAFESFLTDSVMYETLDDLLYFFDCVFSREDYEKDFTDVPVVEDWRMVYDRYIKNLKVPSEDLPRCKRIVEEILRNCSVEQLTRLYYKNNMYDLLDSPVVQRILVNIFNANTEFLNPNEIPEEIQGYVDELWGYVKEFVFWNHSWTERIRRLQTQERNCVVGVDTDSNMVHLQPFVDYMEDVVWPKSTTTMSYENKVFTSANICTAVFTFMIKGVLKRHTDLCNVLPEEAAEINMKNEFLWSRCLWTDVKKRYVTRVLRKEGKRIKEGAKNELDIKGFDFKKAAVNEEIANRLASIILHHIMRPDKINVSDILAELNTIENEIIKSAKDGDRTYCLRMSCKEPRAYARPNSQGAVLSVQLWNLVYPENPIQIPAKCDIALLKGIKEDEMLSVRDKWPDEVDKIIKYIYHGPNSEYFSKHGIKYLALPNDGSRVPELFRQFIDVNTTITRNLGTFDSIMASLGVPMMELRKGDRNYKYYGNILDV